ncbi:MAG: DUF4062 domain-containing protein [Candidatus Kapabacteria bacterium]|nr:DUF4062 domain-containing protein [Candidatus Kapabacteria bacterium]
MLISKLKVFISSTIKDLPSERKAALNAIENTGCIPIMSEFTIEAQNTDSITTCLNKVCESDIYVLILGGKYGWQPENCESITELEYKKALQCNLSIYVFNTTYQKEDLQKDFASRVEEKFFRKIVNDAFELQVEIEKSLKVEIEKKQNENFSKTEFVYSNLVKISFPQKIFRAQLNIEKNEINVYNKIKGYFKKNPSLHDYAVSALHMKNISFPHDWIVQGKSLLTFHDLNDPQIKLREIVEIGTVEKMSCDEVYETNDDEMLNFKYLLKKCLEAKLYKLKVKWIKDEGLFAFLPINKDENGLWLSRKETWSKINKATRTVVDVKRDIKETDKIFNMKCLSFRTRFEYIDEIWYLAIKPDWVFLWPNLKISDYAVKNIKWLKMNERNIHVFNHFNFILHFLQPSISEPLFEMYKDYPFLSFGNIEKFSFEPIIPDEIWINLESKQNIKKLIDNSGNVDMFNS